MSKAVKQIEQAALGPLYRLAMLVRGALWRIRQPRLLGVRGLAVRRGEVLLVRHRAGRYPWSLPGGAVDPYERLVEAVRREIHEETGVIARVEHLLGMYESFGDGVSNYIAVFVCMPLGDPAPPRSIEIAEARFFPLTALPANLDPPSRRRIAEYMNRGIGLSTRW